jgi:hypothetical protein
MESRGLKASWINRDDEEEDAILTVRAIGVEN